MSDKASLEQMPSSSQSNTIPCEARLGVPGAQGLDGATEHDHLLGHSRIHWQPVKARGGRPSVLHVAEPQVERDGVCELGQQRALLQLICQDGGVAGTPAQQNADQAGTAQAACSAQASCSWGPEHSSTAAEQCTARCVYAGWQSSVAGRQQPEQAAYLGPTARRDAA